MNYSLIQTPKLSCLKKLSKVRLEKEESKIFRDLKKSLTIRQDSAKSYKETKPNFSREEIFFLSTMALGGRV